MKECFPCRRPGLGYHLTRDIITRPRIEWPRLRATPDPDLVTLASIVPDFPRIGAPIRDFVARDVPRPPGFDVDGVTRLFTPDLINPSSVYKILLFVSCAAAFVYLEGVALIQDLLQEMDYSGWPTTCLSIDCNTALAWPCSWTLPTQNPKIYPN